MTNATIEEYYELIKMYETLIYGLKWLNKDDCGKYESIIKQSEYLLKKFLKFGINHIGIPEE